MPPFGQPKNPRAVVCLGKIGDLINLLPILKHFHDSGQPHDLVHCGSFTSVLLGVTYAHPVPLRLSPNDADKAVAWAESRYDSVLRLHEFGKGYAGPHDIAHNARQWLKAGLTLEDFHNLSAFPLVFDNRSSDREEFLFKSHIKTKKPLLLLALKATSSPFAGHHILAESIHRMWSTRFEIVDLCRMKAARIYDMLVFLERATALVCVDGAFLHLAAAAPSLPVIALLGDNVLTAAEPRYKPVLRLKYSEAVKRAREIHNCLGRISALT